MMKKRRVLIALALVAVLVGTLWFGTGFRKRSDVVLSAYSTAENGAGLTIDVSIAGSIGYTRACAVKEDEHRAYATFYATFGGLNSDFGAKRQFELALSPACTELYFDVFDEGQRLVLQKNETTGEWESPT